ncbi:MAG: ABC transporter ATP-binding protein [Lachnospiraceae bacterium]|jgi:ATP-binding cassette subfamily B multidrug efflux pump
MSTKENKTRNFSGDTVRRLISYMRPYRKTNILIAVSILISAIASAASSMFLENLIDDYILPLLGTTHPVYTGLIRMLGIMAVIYAAGTLGTLVYNRLSVTVAQSTLKNIRDDMFTKMQKLPIRFFDTHSHGEIMSLYTNDTDTLRQMIAQSLPQFISSAFTMVAVFCCMLYISVWLTLATVVCIFAIIRVVKVVAAKSGTYFAAQQKTLAEVDGYVEEMINGQKVIKVFCHEKESVEGLRKRNEAWRENSTEANGHANSIMPLMNAFGYVLYIVLALIGGYMAIAGMRNFGVISGSNTLTLGMIASFLTLSRSFINPLSQISNQMNSVITALAGAERIFRMMDEKPEVDDGYVTLVNSRISDDGQIEETEERTGTWAWKHPHHDGTLSYTKLTGAITMDHVDFGYTPDKIVLHDITLRAMPGQKIAFVGATGAGKTTITNLINRFYDIGDGKIRYDNININKIKKYDLRRSLGVVLQDVNLFTGTVMDNIRFGKPDATDEECVAAAKLANADNFIRMLPDGYQTVLTGGGAGLSQGQRQLISIARAAVSDPPVMILDEATSSIDTRTEKLVQDGMDRLMEGRTVFVIAHRLSTVQNADDIIVLDHGRIIEEGNHDELIAKKGVYYQLYTGAFELE